MPTDRQGEFRITRTALGGAADASIEEATHKKQRQILELSLRSTQSIGNQNGQLLLKNYGGRFDAWKSGDGIKVEGRLFGASDYLSTFDGFLGAPDFSPDVQDPVVRVPIIGWSTIMDRVNLAAEKIYVDTAWTSIADDLITTVLGAGYARSITADASVAARVVVPEGMSLRQALEIVRSGLNVGTDKWEHLIEVVAGVKTYRLFKRASTIQRTIRRRDLYPESRRNKGSVLEVINKVKVIGATISKAVIDKTTITKTNSRRLDASTKRLAYPFTAPDTPLYGVSWTGARSKVADPPSLTGYVARSSDNLDMLARGYMYRRSSLIISDAVDTPGNMVDNDVSSKALYNGTAIDGTVREVATWDFGAAVSVQSWLLIARCAPVQAGDTTMVLQSSPDNSAWTTRASQIIQEAAETLPPPANYYTYSHFAAVSERYWRLAVSTTSGSVATLAVYETDIYPWRNEATTPTFRGGILRRGLSSATEDTDVATTGAAETELARFDLITARAIAKIAFTHTESSASSLLNLLIQRSDDGSAWTDLAILSSTTSTVTDTIYVEEADFRYLRALVDDDRSGGSASITVNGRVLEAFVHGAIPYPGTTPVDQVPLTGDEMTGSSVSWDVSSLVTTPGTVEQRTYPTPRLALMVGRAYFFVLSPAAGSTTSYWDVDYGTESGAIDSLSSTDSGATWTAIAADAVLRFRLEFNNSELIGEAEDAASQATYASLVPGGVLFASYVDPSLQTQAAVDAEAQMIINRNKNTQQVGVLVIPGDPSLVVGSRVTLAADAAEVLGYGSVAQDIDVVEVHHQPEAGRYRTTLIVNEHFQDVENATGVIASVANQRRS